MPMCFEERCAGMLAYRSCFLQMPSISSWKSHFTFFTACAHSALILSLMSLNKPPLPKNQPKINPSCSLQHNQYITLRKGCPSQLMFVSRLAEIAAA